MLNSHEEVVDNKSGVKFKKRKNMWKEREGLQQNHKEMKHLLLCGSLFLLLFLSTAAKVGVSQFSQCEGRVCERRMS